MEIIETEVAVIGAGVVGLAVASELSKKHFTLVLETHQQFGTHSSSRNSEVIHSGIYYPKESLKTELCIEGRQALYQFCQQYNIAHRKLGKLVVATCDTEVERLDQLYNHSLELGVPCERWTEKQVLTVEPLVKCHEALYFSESGIIDSHQLMACLETQILGRESLLAYGHEVTEVNPLGDKGWSLLVKTPDNLIEIVAKQVVNAAGLFADRYHPFEDGYTQRWCRGRYFQLPPSYQNKFKKLIYPIPPKDGLGVHVTIDLEGHGKLGPDVEWVERHESSLPSDFYDCHWEALMPEFQRAAGRYCPPLADTGLSPLQVGIRSKLFLNNVAHRDFVVHCRESYVSCLGIESPGLTASLALAKLVNTKLLA